MSPEPESGNSWYGKRERGASLGIRIAVWAYRRIGRGAARLLLYPIVAYFVLSDAAGRRASRDYLERVGAAARADGLPDAPPGKASVFRHFHTFALTILDRFGFWLGDPADVDVSVEGLEHLEQVPREGRGALVLGSHLGSFEAMRLLADSHSPIPVHVVMYTRNAPRINAILEQLEEASGGTSSVRIIEVQPGAFEHVLMMRSLVRRGEVVAVLADRVHPNEAERVCCVDFLGAPANLPTGPWLLASALGCPVLMMTALRRGEGRYEITVERLADRVTLPRREREAALGEYCQGYADRLAHHCVREPYQWFNFYDFWSRSASSPDV